jgi:hypothetical protein
MVAVQYRTIGGWSDPETPAVERRSRYSFKATAHQTQQLLRHEAEMIRASDLIVEVVGKSELFYRDGTGIRSDRAHHVLHPGVVVHLVGTKFGDLRYACDTFDSWEANLRAVALGLEALRKVERYGIARRGEQYAGWAQLPPGTPMGAGERPKMTLDHAAAVLAGATDGLITPTGVLADSDDARLAYRMAAKRYHPDAVGGSAEVWAQVDEAWQLVTAHHG